MLFRRKSRDIIKGQFIDISKNLSKQGLLRKSGSGRTYKLTNMHKQIIFEIIKFYYFLTVKEIAERTNCYQPEVDHISPTTVWRFIRSQGFLSKLIYRKHILTETQKLVRKKFWEQIIDWDWTNVIFIVETTFKVNKRREDVG